MTPFEISYRVGVYRNSILVQAEDAQGAQDSVTERHLIPEGAVIVEVKAKG